MEVIAKSTFQYGMALPGLRQMGPRLDMIILAIVAVIPGFPNGFRYTSRLEGPVYVRFNPGKYKISIFFEWKCYDDATGAEFFQIRAKDLYSRGRKRARF